MLSCEQIQPLLDAYRTGELAEAELDQVQTHISTCAACTQVQGELATLAASLRSTMLVAPNSVIRNVLGEAPDKLGQVETVLGPVWVGFNARGVTFVAWDHSDFEQVQEVYRRRLRRDAAPGTVPERLARAVSEAADGRWSRDVPVDLEGLPQFERAVLERMRAIPRGELRPYAWLAAEAGSPRAVRAVGNIMNRNPIPLLLPCHRVVPTSGGIGNYAYGSAIKRGLLEREGVSIPEIESLSRRRVRYLGSDTTKIYCYPTCRDARRIQPPHQVQFASELEAAQHGYRPCLHCRPLSVAS